MCQECFRTYGKERVQEQTVLNTQAARILLVNQKLCWPIWQPYYNAHNGKTCVRSSGIVPPNLIILIDVDTPFG